MGRPKFVGASFNPEESEVLPGPPTLFKDLYLVCPTCNTRLTNQRYAFFPSTLFIEGRCERCDVQRSAFFAPEPGTYQAPSPVLNEVVSARVDAFIAYLAGQELAAEAESTTSSAPVSAPDVFSGTHLDDTRIEPFTTSPQENEAH